MGNTLETSVQLDHAKILGQQRKAKCYFKAVLRLLQAQML